MIEFRTSYDRESHPSSSGSPWIDNYKMKVNKETGRKELTKIDVKDNLYDYIQSFADSVDINVVLAKFANGDMSAINHQSGFYGDFTNLPNNIADIHNKLVEMNEFFDNLPKDVREKFDNSYDVFINSFGSQEWFDTISETKDDISATMTDEKKESEVKSE